MVQELVIKIKNMSVRITLAQNRDKSKNNSLHSKTFAIGRYQTFGGQFGGAVKRRLDGERAIFRGGDYGGFPVNGPGGREGNPADARQPHGFEDVPGGDRILVEIPARMLGPETD